MKKNIGIFLLLMLCIFLGFFTYKNYSEADNLMFERFFLDYYKSDITRTLEQTHLELEEINEGDFKTIKEIIINNTDFIYAHSADIRKFSALTKNQHNIKMSNFYFFLMRIRSDDILTVKKTTIIKNFFSMAAQKAKASEHLFSWTLPHNKTEEYSEEKGLSIFNEIDNLAQKSFNEYIKK